MIRKIIRVLLLICLAFGLFLVFQAVKYYVTPIYMNMDTLSTVEDVSLITPGLGLEELHKKGYTGKGINIAIIDSPLIKHFEFKDRIVYYEKIPFFLLKHYGHGIMVTSILVGKRCGVLPEANLHYFAVNAAGNTNEVIKAINRLIEYNKTLPYDSKIRLANISSGYEEDKKEDFIKAIKKARNNGIIVFTTTMPTYTEPYFALRAASYNGDMNSIDDIIPVKCRKDILDDIRKRDIKKGYITVNIPIDPRYLASHKNIEEYLYEVNGGTSWATPVLTGLAGLVLQVNPDLTNNEILNVLKESIVVNKNNLEVIWPEKVIENAKNTLSN